MHRVVTGEEREAGLPGRKSSSDVSWFISSLPTPKSVDQAFSKVAWPVPVFIFCRKHCLKRAHILVAVSQSTCRDAPGTSQGNKYTNFTFLPPSDLLLLWVKPNRKQRAGELLSHGHRQGGEGEKRDLGGQQETASQNRVKMQN